MSDERDIVERLRATARAEEPPRVSLWLDAADEIERLRAIDAAWFETNKALITQSSRFLDSQLAAVRKRVAAEAEIERLRAEVDRLKGTLAKRLFRFAADENSLQLIECEHCGTELGTELSVNSGPDPLVTDGVGNVV